MPASQTEKNYSEMTIGERITVLAKEKAESVNAFAVNVLEYNSNSTLTGAIKNNNPTYETLQRIISKTGVSVLWLIKGEGEMYPIASRAERGDCISAREAIEMIGESVKNISESHNRSLKMIDRLIGTHESIMKKNKLIS